MSSDVVVAGATGFIGRAVCLELLRRGVGVDGLSRSQEVWISETLRSRKVDYGSFRASNHSICIHLAGINNYPNRSDHFGAELSKAIELARGIAHCGFAKVVFASSALVYGGLIRIPRREEEPAQPESAYAKAKVQAEGIFLGQGHVVARISNVYGPGMPPGNVISDILNQIPGDGPLALNDLLPIRDYIHVTDVARGLVDLALREAQGIFNLGTGEGVSVGRLAATLTTLAGEEGRPILSKAEKGRPSCVILDPEKMKKNFGWKALIRLSEGLKPLVNHPLPLESPPR